jgi:BASS family bile acid:Na+ symporter
MSLEAIVALALPVSIWLVVLSLGAKMSFADAIFLIRRPGPLFRALIAIFVVVPAFALFISSVFSLSPAIKFALVALAVSPIPPVLPLKQMKLGAREDYVIGLLVAASIVSLVATPLLVDWASSLLGAKAAISPGATGRLVGMSVGLPLLGGFGLKIAAPRGAEIVSHYAQLIGTGLLAIGLLAVVISAGSRIIDLVGNGAVVAIVATVLVGLLAGHLLAGVENANGALALAAATRHPGVAIAIGAASFPEQKQNTTAAVLLFLLVNIAVTAPYVQWMKARAESTVTIARL